MIKTVGGRSLLLMDKMLLLVEGMLLLGDIMLLLEGSLKILWSEASKPQKAQFSI